MDQKAVQMTIEEMYYEWQHNLEKVERAKQALINAESDAKRAHLDIKEALYKKRDTHMNHYGKQTIQSGSSVFSFDFITKSGSANSIENFELVKFPSFD